MATTTHIQSGAQRRLATMFLLVAAIGGGSLAGRTALPAQPSSAAAGAASSARASSYGWPVKPFDRQHPVRGNFADPRSVFAGPPTRRGLFTGRCACFYHQGIDISAPDGTAVFPVRSGVVRTVTREWIQVDSDDGVAFQYWHIHSRVQVGDRVQAEQTVLGHIMRASGHVHLTELKDGTVVNPLAPGHIGPYSDTTTPRVHAITFRSRDAGADVLPEFLHGKVIMVASASDTQSIPVPGKWNGLPVSPAKLTYHVTSFPQKRVVIPETTAVDVTRTLPSNQMWHTYAPGSHMNMVKMGFHRYWYNPGVYLFKLTPEPFNTRTLQDGVYEFTVTAWDTAGNHSSATQIFQVHNRADWLKR
jgi:murein DD-endopeptidase MepM/ murein hydrolase activator NlpD